VRYRLRRIEETTGRSLSVPTHLAEFVTAVRRRGQNYRTKTDVVP
jgi:DNA-binding PucR family transcriptional regulator